ncbi:hypothetical protein M3Y94_00190100 [Aphelenchoides besseyi]|nr:hypothetical protein M3Y94_00190100 [Aphelenchoides besseyi]KAI6236802.1 hypothetical protein M3Y95_00197100 [Aphelenchoides besseyi]
MLWVKFVLLLIPLFESSIAENNAVLQSQFYGESVADTANRCFAGRDTTNINEFAMYILNCYAQLPDQSQIQKKIDDVVFCCKLYRACTQNTNNTECLFEHCNCLQMLKKMDILAAPTCNASYFPTCANEIKIRQVEETSSLWVRIKSDSKEVCFGIVGMIILALIVLLAFSETLFLIVSFIRYRIFLKKDARLQAVQNGGVQAEYPNEFQTYEVPFGYDAETDVTTTATNIGVSKENEL